MLFLLAQKKKLGYKDPEISEIKTFLPRCILCRGIVLSLKSFFSEHMMMDLRT
jgi:hypothetical protein